MSEEDKNKKILLMKIGVVIFTVIILFIWILNLKNVWHEPGPKVSPSNQASWVKLRTDLNKTLGNIQGQLEKNNQASKSAASSTDFLIKLIESTKSSSSKITNTAIPTSTASPANLTSSTNPVLPLKVKPSSVNKQINNRNCPQYINCMPTVDSPARSCQIPPGCKNITTLVY